MIRTPCWERSCISSSSLLFSTWLVEGFKCFKLLCFQLSRWNNSEPGAPQVPMSTLDSSSSTVCTLAGRKAGVPCLAIFGAKVLHGHSMNGLHVCHFEKLLTLDLLSCDETPRRVQLVTSRLHQCAWQRWLRPPRQPEDPCSIAPFASCPVPVTCAAEAYRRLRPRALMVTTTLWVL